jgi:hypothetical protein
MAVHTVIPPPFAHAQVHAILDCGYFSLLVQRLWNRVVARSGAFFDQVSCGTICDIGFGHERSFLAKLLYDTSHGRWLKFCCRLRAVFRQSVRRMIQTGRGCRKISLCAAAGCSAHLLKLSARPFHGRRRVGLPEERKTTASAVPWNMRYRCSWTPLWLEWC